MVIKDLMVLIAQSRGFPSVLAKFPTWLSPSGHLIIPQCNWLSDSLPLHLKMMCGELSGTKMAAVHHPGGCYTSVMVEVSFPPSL